MSGKPQGRKPRERTATVSGGEGLWGFEQGDVVGRFDRRDQYDGHNDAA
jgi:hypothetical protein